MSDMFGTPYNRGCFFKLKYDSTDSKGAVLAQGFSNSEISNTTSKGDTVVVVGFSAERQEMMSFVKCFSLKRTASGLIQQGHTNAGIWWIEAYKIA